MAVTSIADAALAASPAPLSSARTVTVSTAAELQAAIASAQSGDIIALSGGNYGNVRIPGAGFPGNVTITAADPKDRPVFNTIYLDHVSGITFDRIKVQFTPTASTKVYEPAVTVETSSDVTFTRCTVTGGNAVNGIDPSTVPGPGVFDSTGNVRGFPTGIAIAAYNSQDIAVTGSNISKFNVGISLSNSDRVEIRGNEIHDTRSSPINGGSLNDITVANNYIHDINPWKFGGYGDHGDLIHFWTNPFYRSSSNNNISITGNFFSQGNGAAINGISIDDDNNGIGTRNLLIRDNVIFNGDFQGVILENVYSGAVVNNTLLQSSGDATQAPGIRIIAGSTGLTVANNITGFVENSSNAGSAAAAIGNNLFVQRFFSDRSNYYGDLFVDALNRGASLEDLLALPGTVIGSIGMGANATQFQTNPAQPIAVLTEQGGTGFALSTLNFAAPAVYDASGLLDLSGATVRWSFGDGASDTGANAVHSYRAGGTYVVTATIDLADGRTVVADRTIEVRSPFYLDAKFNGTADDTSDVANAVTVDPQVALVKSGNVTAVKLNGGLITYGRTPDFFDNPEITVSASFQKLAPGDAGTLITFAAGFSIAVTADGLFASVVTDRGTAWLNATGLGLTDTGWHDVVLTFSSTDGAARLYLDGRQVTMQGGLQGAVQTGDTTQDIYVGTPWGTGFPGLIDNVGFAGGALSAAEVAALHATNAAWMFYANLTRDETPDRTGDETLVLTGLADTTDAGNGEDRVIGLAGDDSLSGNTGSDFLDGGLDNDRLSGGGGTDSLFGDEGSDLLFGGDDNDRLFGDTGADQLDGGAGNDVLRGGIGDDRMTGGIGRDRFILSQGDGADQIRDFDVAIDLVVLRGVAGVTGFADLVLSDGPKGVTVSYGSDQILLLGLQAADLQAGNFVI